MTPFSYSRDAAPLFAAAPGTILQLSEQEYVFKTHTSSERHVMTQDVLQALQLCRTFDTLDAHQQRVLEELPHLRQNAAALRHILEGLAQRQLLIGAKEWLVSLRDVDAHTAAPWHGAALRANGAVADTAAALDALLGHWPALLPRQLLLLVPDDADAAERVRIARELCARAKVELQLCDASTRRELRQRFGLTQDARLLGESAAALHNFALLSAAGRRLLWLDDSQRLPLRGLGGDGIALLTAQMPRTRLIEGGRLPAKLELDAFANELDQVGRPLAAVLSGLAVDAAQLRGLDPDQLSGLSAHSRIAALGTGFHGRSRSAHSLALLFTPELVSWSSDTLTRALDGEGWWQTVAQRSLLAANYARPIAVDLSRACGFMVDGAGDDDPLFAALTHWARPFDPALLTPFAIGSEGATGDRRANTLAAQTPALGHFLADHIMQRSAGCLSEAPTDRFEVLATELRDLARAAPVERERALWEHVSIYRTRLVSALQSRLEASTDDNAPWMAVAREVVEANGKALLQAKLPRLAGWPDTLTPRECAQRLATELHALSDDIDRWRGCWQRVSAG